MIAIGKRTMSSNMHCKLSSTVGILLGILQTIVYTGSEAKKMLDHHQGFNSSIGTFHSIMRSITTSQAKIRALRESLVQAKVDLSSSKPEVKKMVDTSQKYDTMLRTLNLMFDPPYRVVVAKEPTQANCF